MVEEFCNVLMYLDVLSDSFKGNGNTQMVCDG